MMCGKDSISTGVNLSKSPY